MSGQDKSEKTSEQSQEQAPPPKTGDKPGEHGGPKGPEPTRYQDWERGGRCVDF